MYLLATAEKLFRKIYFIGLVGPNGAGKTTFLKTLLGNIKALSGTIEKKNIVFGYVPQRDVVQPLLPYTVHDVVMMGRYSFTVTRSGGGGGIRTPDGF